MPHRLIATAAQRKRRSASLLLAVAVGACGGGGGGDGGGIATTPTPAPTPNPGSAQGPAPAPGQIPAPPAQAPAPAPAPAPSEAPAPATALPTVSAGFSVEIYATVNQPMKLSFGSDGELYFGRHEGNLRIHRIAPGGSSVSEFGPTMVDPDAVLFDSAGLISGIRDSVLVGGGGVLTAISPTQTATVVFNSGFVDSDDMKFDLTGRLVFSDDLPQVLTSNGSPPTALFSTPSRPGSIAIDDFNRIFVALADGTIAIHNADGTLADSAFATGLAGLDTYIAFGPGQGGFGNALYVLSGSELLVFNERARPENIGSGFSVGPSSGTGFVFGPDNELYVSDFQNGRVLRVSRGRVQ
jgi:hypothetical protein